MVVVAIGLELMVAAIFAGFGVFAQKDSNGRSLWESLFTCLMVYCSCWLVVGSHLLFMLTFFTACTKDSAQVETSIGCKQKPEFHRWKKLFLDLMA